ASVEFQREPLIAFKAAEGPHVMALDRAGFETITSSIVVRPRETLRLKLKWKRPPEEPKPETRPTAVPAAPKVPPPPLAPVETATLSPDGRPSFRAVRARVKPKIDGVLDDEVWQTAPRYAEFYNSLSAPKWRPVDELTEVAF